MRRTRANIGMRSVCGPAMRGLLLGASVLLLACSEPTVLAQTGDDTPPLGSPAVVFSVTGDVPYGSEEEQRIKEILADNEARSEFLVHVGDIKRGKDKRCRENRYKLVADALKTLEIPAFILPGDNEYNDCLKPKAAWGRWASHLQGIESHWTLPFEVAHQESRPENFAFVKGRVLFVGVSVVGGKLHDLQDWRDRHAAALSWISEQASQHKETTDALVLFGHAHLVPHKHADFIVGFNEIAGWLNQPVLYVHGDGHKWIEDRPFAAPNILRVQITRGGAERSLTVEIYPNQEKPFRFKRRTSN